jgi:hypothetical protein
VGGYQSIFNFGQDTAGFASSFSLLIGTGYSQTTFAQTAILNGSGYNSINNPVTIQTYAGTAMNDHEALIAAEIAYDANTDAHWIFVGGATGLSVLTDNTLGYTWDGDITALSQLAPSATFTFKTVGDFSYIKKLVWDASSAYLYVLTSTELYQIALDANKFTQNPTVALNPQLILSSSQLCKNPAYFLDLIIDTGFCVLGTTNGLYTFNVNGSTLQQITIPSGLPAASQLIVIASDPEPQRHFKTLSNLIVLNNTFGTQQARINRFVITNGVITPFNDFLTAQITGTTIQGIPTSLIKFDNYISNYFTDGTWNIASSYFLGLSQPYGSLTTPSALQLFSGIRTGFSSSQMILPMLSGYAPLKFITGANLAGFVRESNSGSVIAYGSFQAQANV